MSCRCLGCQDTQADWCNRKRPTETIHRKIRPCKSCTGGARGEGGKYRVHTSYYTVAGYLLKHSLSSVQRTNEASCWHFNEERRGVVREYVYRTRHTLALQSHYHLTEAASPALQRVQRWPGSGQSTGHWALLASRPPSRPAVTAFLACWPACLTSYLHCPPQKSYRWPMVARRHPATECHVPVRRTAPSQPPPQPSNCRGRPEVVATTDIFILGPGQQPGQARPAGLGPSSWQS